MKCVICNGGETKPGVTSVLLTRDGFTFVMRDVPAEICDICGEDYINGDIAKELYHLADKIKDKGSLLDVRKYQVNTGISTPRSLK